MAILGGCIDILRYWYYARRFPWLRRLGYPALGIGLEQRARRCEHYWQKHLAQCKAIQRSWLRDMGSITRGQLWILGAGRLHDVDLIDYEKHFANVALLDADPLSLPVWQRQQKLLGSDFQMSFSIEDITGTLPAWAEQVTSDLAQSRKAFKEDDASAVWRDMLHVIAQLPNNVPPHRSTFLELPKADAVLSLNLLSQIPLVWQDWLERMLCRAFGKRWVTQHEEEWLAAYFHSARQLVRQHLRDLGESGADSILLITDIDYCRYSHTSPFPRSRCVLEPCVWTEEEGWTAAYPYNNGSGPIELEVIPALYGFDIEQPDDGQSSVPGYRCTSAEQWMWHIAPLGIEEKQRGTIHRVAAFTLAKE